MKRTATHGTPRNPRDLPPKENPDRPPRGDEPATNPLMARIAAAVEQFGRSLTTRARTRRGQPIGIPSRSRRDGFQPAAKEHVRLFLLHEVLDIPVRSLAWARGVCPGTIYRSIEKGRRLVLEHSEAGFNDPDGARYERDPDAELGFSDPDQDG